MKTRFKNLLFPSQNKLIWPHEHGLRLYLLLIANNYHWTPDKAPEKVTFESIVTNRSLSRRKSNEARQSAARSHVFDISARLR